MIDLNSAVCTVFGVALLKGETTHFQVPVTPSVKDILKQMLQTTLINLGNSREWTDYDCADQYPSTGHLKYDLSDPVVVKLQNLFTAQNVTPSADALSKPSNIDYYFAKFRDAAGIECMGIRKAAQFKGPVGKSLMTWIDGQLTMVQGDIFRLDTDFDFLVFPDQVAIYRPHSFERIADLEAKLAEATPTHIEAIAVALPFLDLGFVATTAGKSIRARRLVAAIRARSDIAGISVERLKSECQKNGISVVETEGKWHPELDHEIGFLEMLDRRRYYDPLIEEDPDPYRAASRSKMRSP